jgi:hypothetical protein
MMSMIFNQILFMWVTGGIVCCTADYFYGTCPPEKRFYIYPLVVLFWPFALIYLWVTGNY